MRRTLTIIAIGVACAIGIVACGESSRTVTVAATSTTVTAPPTTPPHHYDPDATACIGCRATFDDGLAAFNATTHRHVGSDQGHTIVDAACRILDAYAPRYGLAIAGLAAQASSGEEATFYGAALMFAVAVQCPEHYAGVVAAVDAVS